MSQPHYDAPDTEGAARAAQLAAMSVTVIEALARLQAQRAAERAETDERAAAAARAARIADHAAARVTWSAALDDDWLRQASTNELGQAWAASVPWRVTDTEAADTLRRVEAQLHERHPDAMAAYHQARAHGANPHDAMRSAAAHLQRPQEALSLGVRGSAPTSAESAPSARAPRVVAADAYPFPTRDAVPPVRGPVHVITSAPGNRATTTRRSIARQ
jgi:hypothetical protein